MKDYGDLVAVIQEVRSIQWFQSAGDDRYIPFFPSTQSFAGVASIPSVARVTATASADRLTTIEYYVSTDALGAQTTFYGPGAGELAHRFKSYIDPAGHETVAGYDDSQHLISFVRTEGDDTAGYEYFYNDDGQIFKVIYTVGAAVSRCRYSYYSESDSSGNEGDLRDAVTELAAESGWVAVKASHYRYYKEGDPKGFASGIKFIVGPEATSRIAAAGLNILIATDAQIAPFADYYFEYDSSHRVVLETTSGGDYTTTFSYTENPDGGYGFNAWVLKTEEGRPDGSRKVVYTNSTGQAMLSVLESGTDKWYTYFKFDENGAGILRAESSAVPGFDESDPGLVELSPSTGLIHVFNYFGSGSGSGAAPGRLHSEGVKQGAAGSVTLVRALQYVERTVSTDSIYPVAADTRYQSDATGGSNPATTSYAYTWYTGSFQVLQTTTTLPVVPAAVNGSGTANTQLGVYDAYGRLTWARDEAGSITYTLYDLSTGALLERIVDFNTDEQGGAPSGWISPDGLHLTTVFTSDNLARPVLELGPVHSIDIGGTATAIRRTVWTVYRDDLRQVWQVSGLSIYGSLETTLVNPVTITQFDFLARVTDRIQAVRSSEVGPLVSTDEFPQSTWTRWIKTRYDDAGHLVWRRVYFAIPEAGEGTDFSNYNETSYTYDVMHRRNRLLTPGGTITRKVFLPTGWTAQIWVGTSDAGATESDPSGAGAPGNNMVVVSASEYDGNSASGDGNLTRLTRFEDSFTPRVTTYGYDFRDRRTSTDGEIDFYESYTLDNQDRQTQVDQRDTTASGRLVARQTITYDPLGRVCRTTRYGVDPATGAVGNGLVSNIWFDPAGRPVKVSTAGMLACRKVVFDGAGRPTAAYLGYNAAETGYPYPITIAGETVAEQTENAYDAASNLIAVTLRERFHDATGTGALTSPSGAQPKARVSYQASWPDALGRLQAIASYGTNGAAAWTRPALIPAGSATVLVTAWTYNARGETSATTDPLGTVTRTAFDDAGRRTQLLENWVAGGEAPDQNRETDSTYNGDDQLLTLTAKNAVTGDQTTTFRYGTTLADSDLASNLLLSEKISPNDTPERPQRESYTYNRLGQRKLYTDAAGTSHRYLYDALGRVVQDCVVHAAAGVDRTVLRLGYRYEVHGLLQQVTSYSSATVGFGTVVDDVLRTYNAFQQVDSEYPTSGFRVTYGYANGSANTIRPISRACGRSVTYGYGAAGSLDDLLSRVAQLDYLSALDVTSASYAYLGAGTIVQAQYEEPSLELTYVKQGTEPVGDAGDQYTGLDRFGRLVDSRWLNAGASEVDRFKFGYDAASNRLWRQNATTGGTSHDEAYRYDGLYQLETLQRGTLNTGHTGIDGTPAWEEDFAYDETGNWRNYRTAVEGTAMLDQPRTQNAANEITTLSGAAALLGYDAAGNMVRSPQPDDWSSAYDLTYDAWNRLCRISSGETTIATYGYDGLSRRVSRTTGSEQVIAVFSTDWQVLREVHNTPEGELIHVHDFIWGLRALDDLICRTEVSHTVQLASYALRDDLHVTSIGTQDGTIAERYSYDGFGATNVMAPNFAARPASEFEWTVRFCSYFWDTESGLYQVRNRFLHPTLGRWMSRDPIGLDGGSNLYRYVSNAPTWTSDSLGLQSDPTFGALPPGLESEGFPLGLNKPPGTDDLTKILCGCGGGKGNDPKSPPPVKKPLQPPPHGPGNPPHIPFIKGGGHNWIRRGAGNGVPMGTASALLTDAWLNQALAEAMTIGDRLAADNTINFALDMLTADGEFRGKGDTQFTYVGSQFPELTGQTFSASAINYMVVGAGWAAAGMTVDDARNNASAWIYGTASTTPVNQARIFSAIGFNAYRNAHPITTAPYRPFPPGMIPTGY